MRWFRREGRDLPWRKSDDPYAILVSEIMLQQTQVIKVLDYYERWMQRFPTAKSLAAAGEPEVLSLWQGLGYYSRARNLHAAARQIVSAHDGLFPEDPVAIRSLPGVGPYTAAAVATFAFDRPTPPVDGNIARVVARLMNDATPVDSTAGLEGIRQRAETWQPLRGAGEFNEALMELGALVCSPRSPRCLTCPVRTYCAAEEPETLPVKKPRRKVIALEEQCGWVFKEGCLLLEKQAGPRWKGMWRLPLLSPDRAVSVAPGEPPLVQLDYPFTHHRITLKVYTASAGELASLPGGGAREWHPIEQGSATGGAALEALPMTAPHRRAMEALLAR